MLFPDRILGGYLLRAQYKEYIVRAYKRDLGTGTRHFLIREKKYQTSVVEARKEILRHLKEMELEEAE